MVNYKDLGLVNTREMFKNAMAGKYAIAAFNFNNMEQMQAIIQAAVECKSPVILQVSSGARKYANQTLLRYMAQGAVEYAKELGLNIPITLHLDHGDSFELCKSCIDMGFSSVMIDGSHLPYDENVALTKKVVEYAHQFDVTVEGELGVLAGVEDEVSAEHHTYTRPEEVEDFVKKTGVDSLAISIGTSHGANKFKPEQCTRNADGVLVPPPLRFDILKEIEKRIPGFPIVLHGSSSVPQDKVAIINKYGGALKDAIGIPEDQLREAAKSAVCKINIDSDGRLAMTAAVREIFATKPAGEFGCFLREGFGVGSELLIPRRFFRLAGFFGIPLGIDVRRDVKRRVFPAQRFAGQGDFGVAQRRAVGVVGTGFVRRTETDDGFAHQQGRFVGDRPRFFYRAFDGVSVVTVHAAHHVPAVGFKAFRGVVGEPAFNVAVDGDAVVIIERHQFTQFQGTGQGAHFVRNAFHHTAVAHEGVGVVVDDIVSRTVELRRQGFLGDSHPDRVSDTLAQRTGGGFHACGVADFRVTRGFGVQLAEVFQLGYRQIVASEVQQAVNQHRTMAI